MSKPPPSSPVIPSPDPPGPGDTVPPPDPPVPDTPGPGDTVPDTPGPGDTVPDTPGPGGDIVPETPGPGGDTVPPPDPPPPPPPPSHPPPPPPVIPPTPSPVFPPPAPRPRPTPTPVTPSPSPPPTRPTPTPTPVTPSPSPPPTRPTPTPTPVTSSPPPRMPPPPSPRPPANVPGSSPPPPDVPFSPPPPNNEPASASPLSLYPPPSPSISVKSPSSSSTPIAVGVAVGAVSLLGLAALLIFFLVYKPRRRRRVAPPGTPADFFYDPRQPTTSLQQSHALSTTPSSTTPPMQSWQSTGGGTPGSPLPAMTGGTFGYVELEAGTDRFSEANLLGQGGFGHVYKGTVRGQEVAIKKLRAGSGQGHREFRAEVDIISRVHHKNLVSLVGFCIHAEQRLLVYEYVPNKTLESHLHHGSGRAALDWPRRWKIAVGSAKGLAYLHEDCHPKIIHRDIKTANILLDYNYEPKVADFGLAKCQEIEQTTAVSTRVMGTFGYLAPEYAATGKVTDRSDVFSFGVMLLELITGNKPIMTSSDNQPETLVAWAKPLLTKAVEEENYEGLIDPRLDTNYDAYDMARLVACAAAAVRQTARSRPRMTQIVRYLEGELSAEDLNAGMAPGQSAMHRSSRGGDTDEVRRLRKMAFRPGSGTISEYASSEMSAPMSSEYGLNLSSEYTASSAADTEDMTDVSHRTGDAKTGATERVTRRATVGKQAGRAGRG